MATLSVPDGNAIGIASAEGVAPYDTDSVVENNDGVSVEAGDNFDEPSKNKSKHVDLQKLQHLIITQNINIVISGTRITAQ